MRLTKFLVAAAASSLIAAPVVANQASSLSVSKAVSAKASTSAKKSNSAIEGTTAVVAVAAVVAVGVGIYLIADDDNDSDSN